MTDMNQQAGNGAGHDDAETIRVKAEHRQALIRLEQQSEIAVSEMLSHTPMAVRMYLDPRLFRQLEALAQMISASQAVPEHLRGDLGACLNVIDRSIAWGLSPWSVAQGQFTVRKGSTPGYYGRLIIAALNKQLEVPLSFEHFADDILSEAEHDEMARLEGAIAGQKDGPKPEITKRLSELRSKQASWNNVLGKFATKPSTRTDSEGKPLTYQVATYTEKDEMGLGVIVRGKLKGEAEPRKMKVYLRQCQPRNSVIWATDPMTQIIYTAARRFGNAYCPDLLLGVRTEDDFGPEERATMKDVTPPAPPPVDLDAEQIKAGGAPEAQDAPERAERNGEQSEEAERSRRTLFEVTIQGRTYKQRPAAANAIIELINRYRDVDGTLANAEVQAAMAQLPDELVEQINDAATKRRAAVGPKPEPEAQPQPAAPEAPAQEPKPAAAAPPPAPEPVDAGASDAARF